MFSLLPGSPKFVKVPVGFLIKFLLKVLIIHLTQSTVLLGSLKVLELKGPDYIMNI